MKGHDAGVGRPRARPPGDAVVRNLLGDLGVPGLLLAADLRPPVEPLVVELAHLEYALHEAREVLELRPLVVRGPDRHFDVDGFFDGRHEDPPHSR